MNSYISRKTYSLYYRWRLLYDLIYRNVVRPPYVMTIQETLQKLLQTNARYVVMVMAKFPAFMVQT